MIKSFFHEGKLISIEVELKYSRIDKEDLAKPQFLHRIKGYVNEQLVECIDTNNRSLEEQIQKMETICKAVKASIRRKMDAIVKRLIELGFK
jgi:ferritin-like metal-binding protein YciE